MIVNRRSVTPAFMLICFLLCALYTNGLSQEYANYESKHFVYAIDTEKNTQINHLASICEESYERLTRIFDFTLDEKTVVVFRDEADYSNGYAYGFKNWIGIYLPSSNSLLRGSSSWLREVIAHELSHIFSLRKLGYDTSFLGFGLKARSYADHKNTALGLPYSMVGRFNYSRNNEEKWLVEGMAQLGAELAGWEYWDSHRAMHERIRYLNDALIPLPHLKTYSEDSRTMEGIYNQGYSFMRFIYRQTTASGFQRVLAEGKEVGLKTAIEDYFNAPFEDVFDQWKKSLSEKYGSQVRLKKSDRISEVPEYNRYLVERGIVQTEKEYFLLSSKENDYGATSLYSRRDGEEKRIAKGVYRPPVLHGDILYYIQGEYNDYKHLTNNLFRYNTSRKEITPVVIGKRVYAVQPCNNRVYVIVRKNGSQFIKSVNELDGHIYKAEHSMDLVSLACSDSTLLVTAITNLGQDIYTVNEDSTQLDPMIQTEYDERDPVVHNGIIYFSANYSGSHQIYQKRLPDGPIEQLTSVVGGAFEPYYFNNHVYYTEYTEHGFVVAKEKLESVEVAYSDEYMENSRIKTFDFKADFKSTTPKQIDERVNRLRFLGYNFSLNLNYAPLDTTQNSRKSGTKVGLGMGLRFQTPDGRTSLFGGLDLYTGPLNVSEKDKPLNYSDQIDSEINLGISTSAFTPYLSSEVTVTNWTYEKADNTQTVNGVDMDLFLRNSFLNFYLNSEVQLSTLFSLFATGNYSGGEYQWAGRDFTENKWTLFNTSAHLALGLEYSDKEYGIYGVNSGLYASISPELLFNQKLVYDSIADEDEMVDYGYTVLSSKVKVYGDIDNSILVSGGITGYLNAPHNNTASKSSVSAVAEFSLKFTQQKFSFGSSSVIKNPYILMEYHGLLRNVPADNSPQTPEFFSPMYTQNSERNNMVPSSIGHSNNVHTTGMYLIVENLTFFNSRTLWRCGMEFEYADHEWTPLYVLSIRL
ncbi:MAG: M48 family metallopeptidase [Fibrobacterales bacterium]